MRFFALLTLLLGLASLSACQTRAEIYVPNSVAIELESKIRHVLEKPTRIELLTLNPEPRPEGAVNELIRGDKKSSEALSSTRPFHNYSILGRAVIDIPQREAIINALYRGIDENQGDVADCFNPRHGIVAKRAGVTVELLICFECHQIVAFVDGERREGVILTTVSPRETFNRIATELELKLAPAKKP